jgi:sRNA-binding regulator protein Hfq
MEKGNEAKEKGSEQKIVNTLITDAAVGRDALVFLVNNQMEMGKISAVSKYEIEITKKDGSKKIIFKSSIITIELK